jgi:hypothetical protein
MNIKFPRKDENIIWTEHAKAKMKFYGLSPSRVKKILRKPQRKEEGVAPNTIALMQPASVKIITGKPVWRQEIWLMYQSVKDKPSFGLSGGISKVRIISAWRYPGVSPTGKKIPIPDDIRQELEKMI